jgi:hypothetical protein
MGISSLGIQDEPNTISTRPMQPYAGSANTPCQGQGQPRPHCGCNQKVNEVQDLNIGFNFYFSDYPWIEH